MNETATVQSRPLTHSEILVVFAGLMTGMLLAALDQTIVSTALPTIVGELGGLEHLSWVITAYLLASTTSVPLYGKLSDLFGRKLFFQGAILVFIFGSLLSGIAQNMLSLIIFRGVQGLGAGGIMALSQAIIGDIVSPRERGRYQGYMGGVFAFASVAGPLLGGFFTDQLTWRWVFFINLPLGAAALIVTSSVLRLPRRHIEHRIDYLGSVLMVGGVSSLLLVTTWGGREYAWLSTTIVGLTVAAVVMLAVFVWQEMRAPEPILPPRLFRDAVFRVSSGIGFVLGLAMFGAIAFLPVYMQVVKGASATGSGLRMIPMMLGVVTSSVLSGRLISSTGRYRIFPILGTGLVGVALFLLSRLQPDTPFVLVSVFILVLGLGLGMVMQVIVLTVQNSVEHRDMGAATAGVNFFRSMGGAFGVAVFGSVLANRLDYYFERLVPREALQGFSTAALTASPERIRALPPELHSAVVESFAKSLEVVFLVAIPIAIVAFVLSWVLEELPLREHAHVQQVEPAAESLPPADQAPGYARTGRRSERRMETEPAIDPALGPDLLERARIAYGRAIAVSDPVRIRFWDQRGLTMSQLRLLYLISEAGNPQIGELAEEMRVKPATLSGLAERLERHGLIERCHDSADRRVVRVSLTREGRRVLSEIQVAARAYMEPVLRKMGRASVEAFIRALEGFRAAADEVGLAAEGFDDDLGRRPNV